MNLTTAVEHSFESTLLKKHPMLATKDPSQQQPHLQQLPPQQHEVDKDKENDMDMNKDNNNVIKHDIDTMPADITTDTDNATATATDSTTVASGSSSSSFTNPKYHPESHHHEDHHFKIGQYLSYNWSYMFGKWSERLNSLREVLKSYSTSAIDIPLTIDDLTEDDFVQHSYDDLLLHTYSEKDLENMCREHGIYDAVRDRGYEHTKVVIDVSDPYVHRLMYTDESLAHRKGSAIYLVDCFLRRKDDFALCDINAKYSPNVSGHAHVSSAITTHIPKFSFTGEYYVWPSTECGKDFLKKNIGDNVYQATNIEWLCLHDPNKDFTKERPPLPGQQHPGLGIARRFDKLLVAGATKQKRDFLLNTPFRFHNALLYQSDEYFFIDPSTQAFFLTLVGDLESDIHQFGLVPVAWAFEFGCVKERDTGKTVRWDFHQQIRPISNRMKAYFRSADYISYVKKNTKSGLFYIDWKGHPSLSHFHEDGEQINQSEAAPSIADKTK
ncbi:hypothetical protein SAMD00019534_067210 [Acytostelium subglobosum LB1]|uniref:hypothetical protein n=1 Tax=Acytostelium subglobosum LB1 TaxID=1410327 RepID=UPI000644CE94|nr:hypothetical protein SAMD00019534_067210 [Acytostelium subglobosum LB1]GAM23546.1 hypothetical protein SAMD00019534_067210 [Acytostelium subglobosum LB1]|eukprot:XP_012753287.1 hypothetical protein SAMD00019534_067210 [Acytostelium subglobosum LB1]